MKAGWAETYLPTGFWNMSAWTASTRVAMAGARGFPVSPYASALEDLDARDRAASQ